jgi:hypothetical protein
VEIRVREACEKCDGEGCPDCVDGFVERWASVDEVGDAVNRAAFDQQLGGG